MYSILYIEDNVQLSQTVKSLLNSVYNVDLAENVDLALVKLENQIYDLLIIDYYLGDKLGIDLCNKIRQKMEIHTPILFLTKNESRTDTVQALDSGADDYMTKPFDLEILKARIRALIRRPAPSRNDIIEIYGLKLDRINRTISYKNKIIPLKRKEHLLLEYLILNSSLVISREKLLDKIWGDRDISSNTVDVHITRIRNKLEHVTGHKYIETIYGFGYKLSEK